MILRVQWGGLALLVSVGIAAASGADPAGGPAKAVRPPSKYEGIQQKPVNFREPPRAYQAVSTNGWALQVESQLVDENPALAGKAAARLTRKLNEALALLPEASHACLKTVKVFLMYGPKAKADGRDNGAEYHQVTAPACYETLDPRWGHGLVVYCAENYVWLSEFWALKVTVHELAHVYQLAQGPEDQPDIVRAYDHAMRGNLYRQVRNDRGEVLDKAYAIQNPLEYFAELSCMYFTGCDYPPRTRAELKAYDPVGYAMIQKMWGMKDAP